MDALLAQVANQIDQVFDAAPKSIQFPNYESFQHIGQSGSLDATATDLVFEDLLAACLGQGFNLKFKVLISRRDTCIADQQDLFLERYFIYSPLRVLVPTPLISDVFLKVFPISCKHAMKSIGLEI